MVDHDIFSSFLKPPMGRGIPLRWFQSYLSERNQMIITGDSVTQGVHIKLGVRVRVTFTCDPIIWIL